LNQERYHNYILRKTTMTNQLELKIYELEDKVSMCLKRIEELESRTLYQRKDATGQPTGMVYVQGQTKTHAPTASMPVAPRYVYGQNGIKIDDTSETR